MNKVILGDWLNNDIPDKSIDVIMDTVYII